MNQYVVGTPVRFSATFVNLVTNSPGDPTTVEFAYQITTPPGAGQVTGPEIRLTYALAQIIRDGVGLYHVDIDTTAQPGTWTYIWASTGAPQVTSPGSQISVTSPLIPV